MKNKPRKSQPPLKPHTDEAVLNFALHKFHTEYERKFRAGMAKYTTPIWEKSGVNEAFPEVWDLLSYLALDKLQWARVHRLVDELALQYPAIKRSVHFKQLAALVGEKPLAQPAKVHSTTTSTVCPHTYPPNTKIEFWYNTETGETKWVSPNKTLK